MSQSYSDSLERHHDHEIPCADIVRKVYLFIEGQLDLSEIEKYQDHLEVCLPCRDIVHFEKKLIEIIHRKGGADGLAGATMPVSLVAKIRAAMGLASNPVAE